MPPLQKRSGGCCQRGELRQYQRSQQSIDKWARLRIRWTRFIKKAKELVVAGGNGKPVVADDEDKENARRAIDEEVTMLRESQEIMRSVLASVQAKLAECAAGRVSNVSTSVSFGANNHGFQVGTASGAISGISFGSI